MIPKAVAAQVWHFTGPNLQTGKSAVVRLVQKRQAVSQIISEVEDLSNIHSENISFSFSNMDGTTFGYRQDTVNRSASVIKIYVMIEVFKQLENGVISANDYVSRYGYGGTIDQALRSMMHYSSNEAAGALILKVGGVEPINMTIDNILGKDSKTYIGHTPTYSGVERAVQLNITTTKEQLKTMWKLAKGRVVSKDASQKMLILMSGAHDYFGAKSIEGIHEISMKTGYFPDYLFGLSGYAETEYGEIIFSVYTEDWSKNGAFKGNIRAVLAKLVDLQNKLKT